MTKMNKRLLAGVATLALLSTAPAIAQAGTPLLHAPNVGLGDGGPYSHDGGQQFADSFSLAGGGVINQVTFWGGAYNHAAFGAFSVSFFADSAGLPGAQLASTTGSPTPLVVGPSDGYGTDQPLNEFTMNIPSFTAAAGVTYWFSAADSGGGYNFVWTPAGYNDAAYRSGGPWNSYANNGARSSQAFELSNVSGGVPEPATWALMLLGFGAIGLTARRRSVALAA